MKNIVKILTVAAMAGALALSVSSCGEKFLEEVKRDSISTDYLDRPDGVYSMAESLYMQLRQMYYAEGYWAFTNAGTDEFMIGGDGASETYNTYDARLSASVTGSANTASSSYMWDMLYIWLNRANKVIDREEVLKGSEYYNEAMGTAYFIRGFDFLFLVNQHGDIPLVIHASTSPDREYGRNPREDVYKQLISDLENDSRFWKTFKTTWAINQIKTSKNEFDYIAKDGTKIKNEVYFGPNKTEATFSKFLGGMYIINSDKVATPQKFYEEDIDESWAPLNAKMFRLKNYADDKYIPDVKALLIYDKAGKAVNTSLNPNKDGQYPMMAKYLDGAVNTYNAGQGFRNQTIARSTEDYFFKAEALIRQGKYAEGFAVLKPIRERAQFKAGEERDKYMDGGQGFAVSNYRESITAYTNVNAFYGKSSYFYSVGGWDKDQAYRDAVNAKASKLAEVSTSSYPAEDLYVMNFLAKFNPKYASDEYTRAMCFLLNEKSREFYGEYKRWNDLARTRTLADRLNFNDQAVTQEPTDILGHTGNGAIEKYTSPYGGNFDPAKHYLRPIPYAFLSKITVDGHPATQDDINKLQNPGY